MDLDGGGFWNGLLQVMSFLRMDKMADLVVADLENWGVLPVVAIIVVYETLKLLYRKFIRPYIKER